MTNETHLRSIVADGYVAYQAGDYKTALPLFEEADRYGDLDARLYLGLMYYYGLGVPQDYEKAAYYWRKAALPGHAVARFNLGQMYLNRLIVLPDDTTMIYYQNTTQGITYYTPPLQGSQQAGKFWLNQAAKQGVGSPV